MLSLEDFRVLVMDIMETVHLMVLMDEQLMVWLILAVGVELVVKVQDLWMVAQGDQVWFSLHILLK